MQPIVKGEIKMEQNISVESNNLEHQKEQIIELLQNKDFLSKISDVEDIQEFIKYFSDNGIKMSEEEAKKIFDEKKKAIKTINNLSDSELSDIYGGGDTIIINNNNTVSSSNCVSGNPGKNRNSSKPMTAMGGTIVGGIVTIIGVALAGFSAYKWKKNGPGSEL